MLQYTSKRCFFILVSFVIVALVQACAGGAGGGQAKTAGSENYVAGPAYDSGVLAPSLEPTHMNCSTGSVGFVGIEISKADSSQIPVAGKPFPVLVSGNIGNKCGKSGGVSFAGRVLRVSSCSVPTHGVYKEVQVHYTANQDNHFEVVIDTVSNSFDPTDSLLWRFALAPVGYQAIDAGNSQSYQIAYECYDLPPEGWIDLIF